MEETLTSMLDITQASITLTTDGGQSFTIDLPVDAVIPSLLEFDVEVPEVPIFTGEPQEVLRSWQVETRYKRLKLSLPMCRREDGTYYTVTYRDSP